MSGVACVTPVTPSHRRPVLASDCLWCGRRAATGRRYVETESPGYVVRPKTPIEPADTKKPGVISVKFRSVTPAILTSP